MTVATDRGQPKPSNTGVAPAVVLPGESCNQRSEPSGAKFGCSFC